MQTSAILIPSLNPPQTLTYLIDQLHEKGFYRIIVINDGSKPEYDPIFDACQAKKCHVIKHAANQGKGMAIKSGIQEARKQYGKNISVITLDCDGQHKAKDVEHLANKAAFYPEALILGTRNFSFKETPFRSYIGNKVISLLFKQATGISCQDTQTGLCYIPSGLLDSALETEGSGYEYEMNFLQKAVEKAALESVEIETIYENNNAGSHFHVISDSWKIIQPFLKYGASSLLSFGLDYLLFILLWLAFQAAGLGAIFLATVLARAGSGLFNYTLNRFWCFRTGNRQSFGKYFLLWFCQMAASAILVYLIGSFIPVPIAKIIIDGLLFVLSYFIQKNWVFAKKQMLA